MQETAFESTSQETPQAYSLIILDLNMPIMNGYDACSKILAVYDHLENLRTGYVPIVQPFKINSFNGTTDRSLHQDTNPPPVRFV